MFFYLCDNSRYWYHRRNRGHQVQISSDAISPARSNTSKNGKVSLELVQKQRPESYHINEGPVTSDTFQSNSDNRVSFETPAENIAGTFLFEYYSIFVNKMQI